MQIWPFRKKPAPPPPGHMAEIQRLREFIAAKDLERNSLIREVRETEAEIRVLQADMQREASRAVREIRQHRLGEMLDRHDVLQTKAARIGQAIKAPAQLIATYEGLEVDRKAAVTAAQIDRAIADFEAVMDERREAEDALNELRRAETVAMAAQRVEQRPAAILEEPPLADPQTPAKLPDPLRRRLRDAGLLQDE